MPQKTKIQQRSLGQGGFAHWILPFLVIVIVVLIGVKLLTASHADTTNWKTVFTENWNNTSNWTKYDNPTRGGNQGPRIASNFTLASDPSVGNYARLWTRQGANGQWASGGGSLKGNRYNAVKIDTKIRLSKSQGTRGVMLLWPSNGSWADEIDFYEIGNSSRQNMKVSIHEPKQANTIIWGKTNAPYPQGNHKILSATDTRDYTQWHNVEVILLPTLMQVKIDSTIVYKETDPSKIPYHGKMNSYLTQGGSHKAWDGTYYLGMQTAAPGRAYEGHPSSGITPTTMDVAKITISVPNGTTSGGGGGTGGGGNTSGLPDAMRQPLNFAVDSIKPNNITLDWDDLMPGLTYAVTRDGKTVGTVTSPTSSFVDHPGAVDNKSHVYMVTASDGKGNTTHSDDIKMTYSYPAALTKPLGLNEKLVTVNGKKVIQVGWNNLASGLTYTLYRGSGNGDWTAYKQFSSSKNATMAYNDTNVLPGGTYFYKMTAVDQNQHEADSNQSYIVLVL